LFGFPARESRLSLVLHWWQLVRESCRTLITPLRLRLALPFSGLDSLPPARFSSLLWICAPGFPWLVFSSQLDSSCLHLFFSLHISFLRWFCRFRLGFLSSHAMALPGPPFFRYEQGRPASRSRFRAVNSIFCFWCCAESLLDFCMPPRYQAKPVFLFPRQVSLPVLLLWISFYWSPICSSRDEIFLRRLVNPWIRFPSVGFRSRPSEARRRPSFSLSTLFFAASPKVAHLLSSYVRKLFGGASLVLRAAGCNARVSLVSHHFFVVVSWSCTWDA
jgi:hypothetical protein